MNYLELKEKHMNEVNDFPMVFAFNNEQLKEGLDKLKAEVSECCTIPHGGIIRKKDKDSLFEMLKRHSDEMENSFKDDKFLIDAIEYELGNHEYCITDDPTDTINALGINMKDERVNQCFLLAVRRYYDHNDGF